MVFIGKPPKLNLFCQRWKSRDLNVLFILWPVINLFSHSKSIFFFCSTFVVLNLSPLTISLLPSGTILSFSVVDIGETLCGEGIYLSGSKCFFSALMVCCRQWNARYPVSHACSAVSFDGTTGSRRDLLPQMCRYPCKVTRNTKNKETW